MAIRPGISSIRISISTFSFFRVHCFFSSPSQWCSLLCACESTSHTVKTHLQPVWPESLRLQISWERNDWSSGSDRTLDVSEKSSPSRSEDFVQLLLLNCKINNLYELFVGTKRRIVSIDSDLQWRPHWSRRTMSHDSTKGLVEWVVPTRAAKKLSANPDTQKRNINSHIINWQTRAR
jgi:hypothetical protein